MSLWLADFGNELSQTIDQQQSNDNMFVSASVVSLSPSNMIKESAMGPPDRIVVYGGVAFSIHRQISQQTLS
jgi:hypothetical protein